MKTFKELREKTLTPAEIKKREEIAKAMEKDNPDMPMGKKMAIATATAKRVAESLDEGRMKELHGYIERGMSAQQIAKKMKLDVKTIQALMPKKESIEEDRKGMAKLAGLYSKAMRQMPGSPNQKKIKAEIDKLRKELGMNESLEEAVDSDDTGGAEEVSMATKQIQAMRHFLDGIESRVKEQGDMEEWYQNKLTKANDYLKTLYSYSKGDVKESVELDEAVKTTHAVIDTADGNKVVGLYSNEKGAKSGIVSAERPPMNIKNKKTLRVVTLTKPLSDKQGDRVLGYSLPKNMDKFPTNTSATQGKRMGESRAYRDAMRGMKGNTKGMATTKKDRDDEASDDDRKAASKNIIMQLRKAADLSTGANIEFERGKGKVDRATAQNVLAKFNRLQKPIDKEKFQNSIKSLADIKKILGR